MEKFYGKSGRSKIKSGRTGLAFWGYTYPRTEKARNTKIFAKKEFPERTNVGDARPAVSDARGRPDGIVR